MEKYEEPIMEVEEVAEDVQTVFPGGHGGNDDQSACYDASAVMDSNG
ncbi:MAG: hypothetical protein IK083_06015 [Abditibacteriota bacterium]|nr:hypothetical protein [Abditibacteriota bacterium]